MKNQVLNASPHRPNPPLAHKNRRLAWALALLALLVFVTSIVRQWVVTNG